MAGQMRGIGSSILPMIVSLSGACLLRIVWILTVFAQPQWHTLTVLYISYPISWGVTFLIHLLCWTLVSKKALKRIEKKEN
jgi:Na+-driven multidrug efflux pump